MHDAILFISTEPADIEISTSFMDPDDIGMVGIADYIGNKIPIPETIAGVKVNADGLFVLTRQDIEAFFKRRFFELKRLVTSLNLRDFSSTSLYNVKTTIEEKYDTYVVPISEPDNDNYSAETLDSFLREKYNDIDKNGQEIIYILAAVNYQW